ncbi:MAG: hypothetical protein KF802_16540 [Bdellovibrionaceae bacterium]|nr:hypothetical protein [Pseudobdellovibrionaceae bacterium]
MSEWDQFPIVSANKTAALPPQDNAWDAFPLANGTTNKIPPQQKNDPTFLSEATAVAGKLLSGVGYAATAPEMAADMLKQGINWGVGQVVPGYTEAVQKADALRNQVKMIPTPAESVQKLDAVLPEPQTPTGKLLGVGAQAIPSSVALTPNAMVNFAKPLLPQVPNALNAAMRYGAAPAVASEVAGDAVKGTAIEAPVRIGTSLLTSGVMGMLPGGIKAPSTAPTTDELRQRASDAYKRVEQSNVVIDPNAYNGRMNQMFTTLANEGFDPTLHPKAAVALRRMDELRQQPVTMTALENMRRIAKDAAASAEAGERRIGKIMIGQLDDFVENLSPTNTLAGNSANVAQDIKEARTAWSQLRKSETVERLQERAGNRAQQFSNSGEENALRTEFRQLAQNENKMRLFSPEEQEAIRRVARGGPIENTARWLGKWAPTGVVPIGAGAGVGHLLSMLMGPVGYAIPPAVGTVARSVATHLTKQNANLANELMRGGKITPPTNPSAAVLYRALLEGK